MPNEHLSLTLKMNQNGLTNVIFLNILFLSVYKLHYLNDKQKIAISIYIYYTIFPDYFIHNTTNVCSLFENVNNFFNKRGCRLYYSQHPPKSLQLNNEFLVSNVVYKRCINTKGLLHRVYT